MVENKYSYSWLTILAVFAVNVHAPIAIVESYESIAPPYYDTGIETQTYEDGDMMILQTRSAWLLKYCGTMLMIQKQFKQRIWESNTVENKHSYSWLTVLAMFDVNEHAPIAIVESYEFIAPPYYNTGAKIQKDTRTKIWIDDLSNTKRTITYPLWNHIDDPETTTIATNMRM